jgi:hypothetical protein
MTALVLDGRRRLKWQLASETPEIDPTRNSNSDLSVRGAKMSEILSVTRRLALASVANVAASRNVEGRARRVRAKLSPMTRAPPCFDAPIEIRRSEWAEESAREMMAARDALAVSELYGALSADDIETASECIESMKERGMDVSQFEDDVEFALLNSECYAA